MSPPVACASAGAAGKKTGGSEKAASKASAPRTPPITRFPVISPLELAAIGGHDIAGLTTAGHDDLASGVAGTWRVAIIFRLRLALLRPGTSVESARRARMRRAESGIALVLL